MRTWETRHRPPTRKPRRPYRLVGAIVMVAAAFLAVLVVRQQKANAPDTPPASQSQKIAAQEFTELKGKYLFSGTVVIARAVENEARRADGSIDYSQPFSKFSTFNPKQYDAWEFDHECPMTTNNIPYRTQVENTIFNCRPEFLPAMLEHFPNIIANVANNHTRDMGQDGFEQTVELLERGGLQTIGHWDPRQKDEICEVVALPVRLQKVDGTEEKATLPVAFCAWHYFEKDPGPGEYEAMERYSALMPVFAFMQVGVEYRAEAGSKQVSIAHSLIDTGAPEFVIGNSPHWVQNTEAYKGKLIVYSTGNFIFDQLDAETNRGLSIAATMTVPYDDNVAQWLDLGKQCEPRGDNCLELAEQKGLKKVDMSLEYEAIGSSTGYREVTQKAGPSLQQAIEERANWARTLKALSQN